MRQLEEYVDLYTDHIIAVNGQATATGLSMVLDGAISHDKFTRMLREGTFDSKYLQKLVKKVVRQIESEDGCLIVDDTIVEKKWTDESKLPPPKAVALKGASKRGYIPFVRSPLFALLSLDASHIGV